MIDAFFTHDGSIFYPTDHCRGPWDEHACHAGPPTGLLARALEQQVADQQLVRITVDLLRAIPFAGFTIDASTVRQGRTVSTTSATLLSLEGKPIVTAKGLHMKPQPTYAYNTHSVSYGIPENAHQGLFPIRHSRHNKAFFSGTGVQVRYPDEHDHNPGPTTAWLKTVPLLNDEEPSPFQRMCPMADCGNAFSRNNDLQEVAFLNTDLTVMLFRAPVGDWMGSHSEGFWEPNGIGLADAQLFDEIGVVGRALQTLLLKPNTANS
ncbi:MAG: thioesterase family protein [Gammaproteobacteria bacterium]|nr:thioesterase family protein [Gammaproteobacteria bacterium]